MSATAALAAESTSATSVGGGANTTSSKQQQQHSLSSLGGARGVSILLGNHAKFGLAERCW